MTTEPSYCYRPGMLRDAWEEKIFKPIQCGHPQRSLRLAWLRCVAKADMTEKREDLSVASKVILETREIQLYTFPSGLMTHLVFMVLTIK